MFYNTLHFIAYYPALMQLGFIFSVKVTPHDESPFQENARRALNF